MRRAIQRLTNTYVTMALSEIASQAKLASPAEAERYILRMVRGARAVAPPSAPRRYGAQIDDGDIYATINQAEGVVSFQDDPNQYDTTAMVGSLAAAAHASLF